MSISKNNFDHAKFIYSFFSSNKHATNFLKNRQKKELIEILKINSILKDKRAFDYIINPTFLIYFVYKNYDNFESMLSKSFSEYYGYHWDSSIKISDILIKKFGRIKFALIENENNFPDFHKKLVAEHPINRSIMRHKIKEFSMKFNIIEDNSLSANIIKRILFLLMTITNEIRVFSKETGEGSYRYKNKKVITFDGFIYNDFYSQILIKIENIIDYTLSELHEILILENDVERLKRYEDFLKSEKLKEGVELIYGNT